MRGFFEFGSPVITLPVEGKEVEMLLDTGFNGCLMLPAALVEELALAEIGISDYITASGSSYSAKVYVGKVWFLDEEVEVPILATDSNFALAGMELFSSSRIMIEQSKGIVEVTRSG